jgi:hypothetical protein
LVHDQALCSPVLMILEGGTLPAAPEEGLRRNETLPSGPTRYPPRARSATRLLPCIFRGERGDVGVASSAETRNKK